MRNDQIQQHAFEKAMRRPGSLEACKERYAAECKAWEQFVTMAHTAPGD